MTHIEHKTEQKSEQKTAIVTGASRGIGHAVAERFRSLGWRVITVSRSPIPGGCPRSQEHNTHVCMDLSDLSQIGQMVETLRPMLGDSKLHALVNNAGVSPKGPGGSRVNSLTTDMQTWQEMYNTNFFAPLALTRGFAQELSNAHGAVVNLCSIAGYRVHPFAGSAYASSKAALASLTREMANDMAPLNVRVNAIAPGEIDTAILSPGTSHIVDTQIPLRRLGTTAEVADLVEFLCSERASYITGAEIPIDGGQRI
ncbi:MULTISPECIES: SDR family NAD(P)-dependent oxidoreductase [unclassified Janthinobacterium]|uniref:SDR family NAD(P)-dependent oxidoreductase n=1 Tax=unclassified Janthinobacterium TaxID=2610881 RepID=UPI001595AD54|nr:MULTISPECIES: SDR family oxidoreductase [unclassified Janthinobacterium]MBW3513022.1 SDR family oxidoreductase [Janthinobacterium sp. NKUCC06_STL]NVI84017.1 SDR family oxidoreductase [Janthinobacterium sp. BJB401]